MRYLDATEVHARLDYPGLVGALEAAHREPTPEIGRLIMEHTAGSTAEHFVLLPAWRGGEALGIKVATVFPENLTRDKAPPAIQAVYLLFDGRDGTPVACIDGTALTYRKTAADSALAAKKLSRPDVATMAMLGAGGLAPFMVRAHVAVRPSIGEILVWNRSRERAVALAEDLRGEGLSATPVEDAEAAVRAADLICCATASKAPLVRGDWLKPGAHLDLVGGFRPEMREADDEAARIASIFVDLRATTVAETGDIAGPIASGAITEADVLADLFELCGGLHPGRRGEDEITLFKNGGGGHLDLMTARYLLDQVEAT